MSWRRLGNARLPGHQNQIGVTKDGLDSMRRSRLTRATTGMTVEELTGAPAMTTTERSTKHGVTDVPGEVDGDRLRCRAGVGVDQDGLQVAVPACH